MNKGFRGLLDEERSWRWNGEQLFLHTRVQEEDDDLLLREWPSIRKAADDAHRNLIATEATFAVFWSVLKDLDRGSDIEENPMQRAVWQRWANLNKILVCAEAEWMARHDAAALHLIRLGQAYLDGLGMDGSLP